MSAKCIGSQLIAKQCHTHAHDSLGFYRHLSKLRRGGRETEMIISISPRNIIIITNPLTSTVLFVENVEHEKKEKKERITHVRN